MTDTRTHAREEKKLSVIKPGHWRNKWRTSHPAGWFFLPVGSTMLDRFTYLSAITYPSRELAEEYAAAGLRGASDPNDAWHRHLDVIRYLGPVFFPDKSDP